MELGTGDLPTNGKPQSFQKPYQERQQYQKPIQQNNQPKPDAPKIETKKVKTILSDLIGTRGACILDNKLNILGKVPLSELVSTINSMKEVYAVVFDGVIDRNLVLAAENLNIAYLIGMSSRVRQQETKVGLLISNEL
jgi:DNA primase